MNADARTNMATERNSLSYGAGALAVIAVSLGIAAIVYGMNVIRFDPLTVPAWILGPLGIYTIAYSLLTGKDSTYYLVWGAVMVALAGVSSFQKAILPIIGTLLIVLAIIGIIAYWRSKR